MKFAKGDRGEQGQDEVKCRGNLKTRKKQVDRHKIEKKAHRRHEPRRNSGGTRNRRDKEDGDTQEEGSDGKQNWQKSVWYTEKKRRGGVAEGTATNGSAK